MKKPELKGIAVMLLIALVLGVLLAGMSGKLEQWGLPWFTGAQALDKIVFVSDRSGTREIYMMNLDGTDQKQLTHRAKVSAPTVSITGNRIAFVGMLGSASQVMAIGTGGGNPTPLTASTGPKRQPLYSPDGKTLSYIDGGKVYASELNGSNPDPLLPNHAELVGAMGDPTGRGAIPRYSAYAWGPDGESLAGVSSADRITDSLAYLPAHDHAAEIQRLLPPEPGTKVNGLSFAAQSAFMAASVQTEGKAVLVGFDVDEKQPRPILNLPGVELGMPAVSPDGSIVVVPASSSTGKADAGLLRVDLESGKWGALAKGIFENPVFSPSGDTILAAMRDKKNGKRSVVTINPESGEVTRLTRDGDSFGAVYTPASAK